MKRVLFVCVENSNRSQMAEAFARMHGAGRVEAFSAGSRPSVRINPKAVEAMREVGYDLIAHTSKGLDDFNGRAPLPPAPTFARPSSPEKVAILEQRARQRLSLWHPLDAPMDFESSRMRVALRVG